MVDKQSDIEVNDDKSSYKLENSHSVSVTDHVTLHTDFYMEPANIDPTPIPKPAPTPKSTPIPQPAPTLNSAPNVDELINVSVIKGLRCASVLSMIGCIIFGLIALCKSEQSKWAMNRGNLLEAKRYIKWSRRFILAALVCFFLKLNPLFFLPIILAFS
ncbi:DgyrCDS3172 [Dimorphilus gyrociliatus]|uniref:DgyrCDS3172 n=1 Tax=Dimorphilus gyrociliatus TaxID=2664684 RepID=A0A7I8VCD1_9ANNE|nr:DgyrCDS3172 [Dimorphilus gyrociliatus]